MKQAKIFKVVNSPVWTVELYENGVYQESAYSHYKRDAVKYAQGLKYDIITPFKAL